MRGSSLPLAALGLLLALAAWWALSGTAEDTTQVDVSGVEEPVQPEDDPGGAPPTADLDWLAVEPTAVERSEVAAEERAADEDGLWLSARIERPSGAPLASSGVRVELLVRYESGEDLLLLVSVYRPTNPKGGMLADIRGFSIYNRKRVLDAASASVVLSRNVDGTMLGTTVDVDPKALLKRGLDLGTVRLDEAKLVVAGRVVDTQGRPVSGVAVELRHRNPTAPPGSVGRRAALCPTSTTGVTGSFAIRGSLPKPPYHLALLSGAGIQHEGREFELGANDHELVLARNGWLTLEHVDNEAFPSKSRVIAVLESAYPQSEPADVPEHLQPGARHRLSWTPEAWSTSLPPGTYTLLVKRGVDTRPVVELEHLVVPPGTTCGDPRLVGLDLRDYLWPLKVSVVDRLGRPITKPWVTIWDGSSFEAMPLDDQGRIYVDSWPCRLMVTRNGYHPRELTAEGDVEVQLDDASRRTSFMLPGSFARGTLEGAVWHARAKPLDRGPGGVSLAAFGSQSDTNWSRVGFEARRDLLEALETELGVDVERETDWIDLSMTLPGNGRYRVDVALPQPGGASIPDFDVELLRSFEVEVLVDEREYLLELTGADRARAEAGWTGP